MRWFWCSCGWSRTAEAKPFSLLKIEDVEESLPQIVIQGKQFTAVIHKQRLVWPAAARHRFDPDDAETARSFEVRDAAGMVAYRQKRTSTPWDSFKPDDGGNPTRKVRSSCARQRLQGQAAPIKILHQNRVLRSRASGHGELLAVVGPIK
jgi:hypothetical protein